MKKRFSSEKEKHNYFHRLKGEQKIDALCDMLSEAEYAVFLGGAGVSTESGIPDFRSKNGLYRQKKGKYSGYKPEYLLSHECLKREPEVFFPEYIKASRNGRGTRLDRKKRMEVWKVFESYRRLMKERGIRDINTAMFECRMLIQKNPLNPGYAHIVVDEGHLSPASHHRWRRT